MAKKIANALFQNNIVEYGGYQPPKPTDWDKIFDEGEEEIQGVLDTRQAERDKNDEVFNTTEAALTDFTTGVSQDFGNYIGAGLEENRNLTMNMYKKLKNNEISSTQYRMFLNRQQQDWAEMGTFSKEYEARLAELEKRKAGLVDPETGKVQQSSIIEYEYFANEIAQAANFGNKKLVPNASTGGLYSVTYDESSGKAVKSSVMSTQELNNFQKQKVDKVDLTNMIAGYTKRINDTELQAVIFNNAEAIKTAGGLSKYLAETDPRMAASYKQFITSVEDAVTKLPPNQVASALADNVSPGKMVNGEPVISNTGNWFVYSNKSELNGRDASLGVLMVKQQDGSMAAELTEDQRAYLRANTKNIADTQLGYEEEFGVDYTKDKMDISVDEAQKDRDLKAEQAEKDRQSRLDIARLKEGGANKRNKDRIDAKKPKPPGEDTYKEVYINTNEVASGKELNRLEGQKDGEIIIRNPRISPDGKTVIYDNYTDGKLLDGEAPGEIQIVGDDGSTMNRKRIAKILYPDLAGDGTFSDYYDRGESLYSVEERKQIEAVTEKGEFKKFSISSDIDEETDYGKGVNQERQNYANTFMNSEAQTTPTTVGNQTLNVVNSTDPRYEYISTVIDDYKYNIDSDQVQIIIDGEKQYFQYTDPLGVVTSSDTIPYRDYIADDYDQDDNASEISEASNVLGEFLFTVNK